MPWCSKCNMEYREGIKVCADCGEELVDVVIENQVAASEVVRLETEENAKRLIQFLHYSKIDQATYSYDEKDQAYVVTVNKNDLKEAMKLFRAFYIAEEEAEEKLTSENTQSNSAEDSTFSNSSTEEYIEEDTYDTDNNNSSLNDMKATSKSSVYVKKADQFKDLRSTGQIFIVVGIGGFIILLLNIIGVLTFYQGYFTWIVMGALFSVFLLIGLSTLKHSKQVKEQISEENTLTDTINTWLEKTMTQEAIDMVADSNVADEINYFSQIEYIKKGILDEFGNDLEDSYVDLIVEEFYNSHFSN